MTCVIERRKVLEDYRTKQDLFFKTLKDVTAEEVFFSTSLDRTYHYSSSLEKQEATLKVAQAPKLPAAAAEDAKKCKVVVFDSNSNSNSTSFEFKKEIPGKIDEKQLKSALTNIFVKPTTPKPAAGSPSSPSISHSAGGSGGGGGTQITIFLPFAKSIKMKVGETATVDEVVALIVKQFSSNMIPNTKAYIMRMAEEDGTPDDDFPPTGPILRFGKNFVLCKNPDFHPTESDGAKNKGSTSSSGGSLNPPENKGWRSDSFGSGSSGGGGGGGKQILKVLLPNMQYTSFPWQSNMKMKDVLARVCQKRVLDTSSHHFQLLDTPMTINPEMTLGELGVTEVKLCPN